MNAITQFFTKALERMVHPARPLFVSGLLKRTRFDYRAEVGDCLDSSVVTAPVQWLARSLPEANLALRRRQRNGKTVPVPQHPMLELIRNPNPFYGDIALWSGTIFSYAISGNAYWLKVRNQAGIPAELWYVPHWMIEPEAPFQGDDFIDHYKYSPGGHGQFKIDPADVVHIRHGIDPRNIRKGISPIDGVIREIFSDLESSNFVASLLRNMGVPGVVISPKTGAMPAKDDVEATKSWFQQQFGGDRRGGPLVMGAPTDVQPYGFNPQQMNLSEARDVAEERVCACLGVPAAVVGFGAGLQQTKVGATMEELRKLAWHNGVLPMGRSIADEINRSLLPDFGIARRAEQLETFWDTDDVLALQEDEDKAVERLLKELGGGAITLYDYKLERGREASEADRIYLRPFSLVEVPEGQSGRTAAPAAAPAEPPAKARARRTKADGHEGHGHDAPADARQAAPEAMKRGERWVQMLQRQEKGLRTAFERTLTGRFAGWREQALRSSSTVLATAGTGTKGRGSKATDEQLIEEILKLLDIDVWRAELEQDYGAHYLQVATAVQDAAERAGLGTSLPDPVMRAIVASGGKRVGLIDLDSQTRQAIFEALAEARAEGQGAEAMAQRIADHVEGGHWNEAITRARVIARTETKFAQNLSTIETGKAAGVEEFIVFDGRLGPGRSLEEHIARNGSIVSAEDALTMAAAEHPNGTLSFAPHFDLGD